MNRPGSELLFTSIKRGDLAAVSAVIDQRNPHEQSVLVNEARTDITPLMFAVRERQVAIAEKLIDAGANADTPNLFGWTVLLEATRMGQMDMVKMMDGYEMSLTVASTKGDGLMHAAVRGDTEGLVPFFAKRQVPIDCPNRDGITPVIMAAELHNLASFKELVALGADIDRPDPSGMSARQHAASWHEAAEVLENTPIRPLAVKVVPAPETAAIASEPVPVPVRRSGLSGISKRSGMR